MPILKIEKLTKKYGKTYAGMEGIVKNVLEKAIFTALSDRTVREKQRRCALFQGF